MLADGPAPTPPRQPEAWPACWTPRAAGAQTSRPPRCWDRRPHTLGKRIWRRHTLDSLSGRRRNNRPPRWADPAAHTALDYPEYVAVLLDSLRKAGEHEQAATLADRAAAHAPLDDPGGVARLLGLLREAGADEQAAALATRAAAHAPLDSLYGAVDLLASLRAGARTSRPPRCWPATPPPSTTRAAWSARWTACGRRAHTSRPPWVSSISAGKPTAPRPRHGAGRTWTYGLFLACGDRSHRRNP